MMKIKKLLEFANWLANNRHAFYMRSACDCVAGHTARWLLPTKVYRHRLGGEPDDLRTGFDLSDEQATAIYCGPDDATRAAAVAMLRHLAKTRKVDWRLACERFPAKGQRI